MKRFILIISIFALMSSAVINAQVTIGQDKEPNPNAVLELLTPNDNKGFLPPRVALINPHNPAPLTAHVQGMVLYNTNINNPDSLIEGLYMNNGTQWIAMRQAPHIMPNWFYMPSFPLKTAVGSFTVDLWDQYQRLFEGTSTQGGAIRPAGAPRLQPLLTSSDQMYYYVAGFDNSVFTNVGLTDKGILTYSIDQAGFNNLSDSTFMNIILVIK